MKRKTPRFVMRIAIGFSLFGYNSVRLVSKKDQRMLRVWWGTIEKMKESLND